MKLLIVPQVGGLGGVGGGEAQLVVEGLTEVVCRIVQEAREENYGGEVTDVTVHMVHGYDSRSRSYRNKFMWFGPIEKMSYCTLWGQGSFKVCVSRGAGAGAGLGFVKQNGWVNECWGGRVNERSWVGSVNEHWGWSESTPTGWLKQRGSSPRIPTHGSYILTK